VAWYSILACAAALPLVVAVTQSPSGASVGLTDDVYHIPKLLLLTALLLASTLAWAYEVAFSGKEIRLGVVLAPLAAFALLMVVSTAFGVEPVSSLFGVSGLSTGAITWLACAWAGILVSQYMTSTRSLVQFTWALAIGATGVGVIALLQASGLDLVGTPLTPTNEWMVSRGAATLGNPNYTGLYLLIPAVLAVALAYSSEVTWQKRLAAGMALVVSGALFITITRAAWIGLVVGLVLLVLSTPGAPGSLKRRAGVIAGATALVAIAGVLILGPEILLGRLKSLSRGVDAFSSGRLTMWSDTLRAIANRPWAGTGADRLALGAYEVQSAVVTEETNRYVIQDPHSLPLLITGSFGVPALVAFAVYAAQVLRRGFGLVRQNTSFSQKSVLYAAWVAATSGYLLASLLSVYTITGVFLLFVSLALVAAPTLRPVQPGSWARPVVLLLVFALTITTFFGAVQGYRASRHVAQASLGDSQYHLEEAIRLVPWDTRTRVTYQWRKIGSFRQVLTGNDIALAHDTFSTLDTEIKLQIQRSPRELLWYRMRVDMYQIAKGYPGYQPEKVLEAVDAALVAFPNDPEFTEWREKAQAGTL
jgi:O-antigen ligase